MIESSSFFHRNLHIFAIILVYELLKNNLFYIEKVALQNKVNFLCVAEIYGAQTRGKFLINRNIDVESSSLLQCKDKIMYYMCLEGFSLKIIF